MSSARERLRLLRRQPDDAGFSIIELAITGALMSLIGILVMTTVIGGVRTAARGELRTDDVDRARMALLGLTADIRAAEKILEATPTRLKLTTRVPGTGSSPSGPAETVVYELLGSDLRMIRTSTSGVETKRTVLPHVSAPAEAGQPVFRMLSVFDSQKQCTTGPTLGTLGSTVTGPNLDAIYAVDVWLSVNSARHLTSSPLVLSGGAVLATAAAAREIEPPSASLGLGEGCS